jgi:DNA polymerase-3 subunit delta
MKIYNDLKLLKVEPIYLISLLAAQFRLILEVSILMKNGKQDNVIATILNVHPYRVKMAIKHGYNYSLSDVKKILVELATLDAKIKTGEADRYIDFELFLATK